MESEKDLAGQSGFTNAVLQACAALIVVTDPEGRIVRCNRACEAVTGYDSEELRGRVFFELLVSPESRERSRRRLEDGIAAGTTSVFENEWVTKGGERRRISFSNTSLLGEDGKVQYYIATGIDVTERYQSEQELKRAKEAAESANRELMAANRALEETGRVAREMADRAEALSAAKSDFLANMTHEVRTPLNGILGMTGLALQTELGPDQREYLELVQSSAEALLGLVNDVLDFSKHEVGKLSLDCREFSLRSLLREVLRPLALRASAGGLSFECAVDGAVPDQLIGDPLRLGQILRNLVSNAIKFTSQGSVTVRVGAESVEGSRITLVSSVADTGIGIPPDKHGVVFEPFVQADSSTTRKYGGTGLGLSITAGLVDLMQGRIWLESEPGQGSTFHFTAVMEQPVVEGHGAGETRLVEAEKAPRQLRILVAEDNGVNQRLASKLLEREGHQVVIAGSGQQALDRLERGAFDLILMDIQMPDLDGLQATARIRERERGTDQRVPIIAMTAQAGELDRARCLAAGMDAYVTKPVHVAELIRTIEAVVPGGDSMKAELTSAGVGAETQLRQLDEALALSRVGGDMDLLREVAGLFLSDYPDTLEKIRSAVAGRDAAALERSAHSLKGSVSTFGAQRAFEAALALEKQGRSEDLGGVEDGLSKLEQALEALRPELEALQSC